MLHKKVLPFVMALFMIAGLAACATTGAPTTAPSSAAATAAPATTVAGTDAPPQASGPMDPYAQPVTITWSIQTAAASKLLDGDTWENNRWSRLIKEKLNIDLKVAFTADSSTEAYKTKLNAIIASGELPDIFKTEDDNVFLQLAQNGSLADLTGVVQQYQTPEVKAFMERYADAVQGATVDGKLYAIPRANDNFHEAPFLWVRDDWMTFAGYKPGETYPKTVDDMVAMARKFATGDPNGDGKSGDSYGLALDKGLIGAGHFTLPGLAAAYGVPGYGESIFYRDKDGKMTFSWIQPGMKPTLTLLNSMYKEGLINKEFTAKDESALVEDVTTGKIGMAYGSNWGTWYPYNNVFKKDGVITRAYPVPTAPGNDYKVGIESNFVGQMTMVSAACKNPEAAVKILDLYVATVNAGTDNFNRYWNDEQYRLCPVYTDIPNENYEVEIYNALTTGDASKLSGQAKPFYDLTLGFENGTLKDDNAYGTWGQMSKSGSLQWVINKYQPEGAMVKSILGIQRPEIWMQNAGVLDTMTITAFTEIITGAQPVDYFDTFVQDWLKNGGQQTLDELDKLYPAK